MKLDYIKLMFFIIFSSFGTSLFSYWLWFNALNSFTIIVKLVVLLLCYVVYAATVSRYIRKSVKLVEQDLSSSLETGLLSSIQLLSHDTEYSPKSSTGNKSNEIALDADPHNRITSCVQLLSSRLENLKRQLDYDGSTGLYSRRYIDKWITTRISAAPEFTVILFKIQNYPLLVELYGADIATECLQTLASRLAKWSVVSARFNTDELILFSDSVLQDFQVETLHLMLSQPFEHELITFPLVLRAAIVESDAEVMSSRELYTKLDLTLCEANRRGCDYLIFEQKFADSFSRKNEIIAYLHSSTAYQQGEFSIVFQPIVALNDSRALVGTEALIRWHNRSLGDILPYSFISLARQAHLTERITSWITQHIVLDLLTFRKAGHRFPISFNVGNVDKRNVDIFIKLNAMLKNAGLSTKDIIVEIGENELQQCDDNTSELLNTLSAYGYELAIDGVGRSSISLICLTSLPISTVKIDSCLVSNITNEPKSAQCTHAMINLAHSLNLRTIAVGVETSEAANMLIAQGCDAAQGYYFTKPLEMRELVEWLEQPRSVQPLNN